MQVVKKSEKVKAWVADAPEDFRDMVLKIYASGQGAKHEFDIDATVTLTADEFTFMAAQFQAPNETMRGRLVIRIITDTLPTPLIAEFDGKGRAKQIGFEITNQ